MIDCHWTASDTSLHATSSNARANKGPDGETIFVSVCFFCRFPQCFDVFTSKLQTSYLEAFFCFTFVNV